MGQCCDKVYVPNEAAVIEDEETEEDELDEAEFKEFTPSKARVSVSAEGPRTVDYSKLPMHPKTAEQEKRITAAMKMSFAFSALTGEESKRVVLALAEATFKKGESVIKEGAEVNETENGLFILESGQAKVYKKAVATAQDQHPAGKHVHTYTQPGDTFGENALLYNCPRQATVICETECKMWGLDRVSFSTLVKGAIQKRRQEIEQMLETVAFLKSVSADARSKLCDVIKLKELDEGAVVVTQGEPGNEMFIVKSGELQATVDGAVVYSYNPGMYFGELALLSGSSGQRKATVKTTTKSVLLSIDRAAFKRLLGNAEQLLEQQAAAYKPA